MDNQTQCCMAMGGRAARRRQRIVDAARKLFIEKGFHATGVAQIAQQSGIAVGQIYRDFAAKEDIVAAIVELDCADIAPREPLRTATASGDAAAVRRWIRRFIEPIEDDATLAMIAEIMAECARNARIAAIFARTEQEIAGALRDALVLLAPGDTHAARRALLADMILLQSLGLRQHRLLRPDLDAAHLADGLMHMIEHEIAAMCRPQPA